MSLYPASAYHLALVLLDSHKGSCTTAKRSCTPFIPQEKAMWMRLKVATVAFFAFFLAFVTLADGMKLNVDATTDCDCKVKVGNTTLGNTYNDREVAEVIKRGQDLEKRGQTIG
ncbi:hypothetical protein PC9H_011740 [Pleurotus ostreatus]|uniref:Uncharacterized protein n=1 Tax=Pleurotus ostreatus TaxID=5322 RepID=A0A8H6ZJE9_PLEOS|nr:uncharacterized protein PC9H_011740 [Pleurotus ostreatus]KAF7421219.1 hypothetical protein PC9H_011740 [Pleurotus ostreatus]